MNVQEYLNDLFDAPTLYKSDSYEEGAILHTAKSRKWTNATIIKKLDTGFLVLTDIGNLIHLTETDLKENYLPVVCRRVSMNEPYDITKMY